MVPTPGADSSETSPPSSATASATIASPTPAPSMLRPSPARTRWKRWNTRGCCASGMPMPVSRTVSTSWSSIARSTCTDPSRVYFTALLTRLRTTFSHRRTSSRHVPAPRKVRLIRSPARSPASSSGSTSWAVSSSTSTASGCATSRPLSEREISSRSSTIPSSRWHWPLSCSTAARSSTSTRPDSTSCRGPSSRVSGVRSSWLIVDRKWVLAVLSSLSAAARCASSSRARAASSRCATAWESWSRKRRCASSRGRSSGRRSSRRAEIPSSAPSPG